LNAGIGREDIKPTIRNESSHESRNDNGLTVVNFATSESVIVKSAMFPHHTIVWWLQKLERGCQ